MGDPKTSRSKYSGPTHPWNADRIAQEKELVKKYGLKNKKELWKAQSLLRAYRRTARNLQARLRTKDEQAEKEKEDLISKLSRLGMLGENAELDDILALQPEAILNRRLQTVVHLKGLAFSAKQARQFIIHGHIALRGRKVTIPSYHVRTQEDEEITYRTSSPIANELHPMRPRPKETTDLERAEAIAEAPATEEKPVEASKEEKPAEGEKKEVKTKEEKKEEAEPPPKDLDVAPGGDS